MKITNIETLIVDAGWRPWMFVKVETDEGITGSVSYTHLTLPTKA